MPAALVVLATPAAATISGPCRAIGTASSSTIDLTAESVWHVRSTDVVVGDGRAGSPQRDVRVTIKAFGVPLGSIVDAKGGSVTGRSAAFSVSAYSRFARVLAVSGSSTDCSGDVILIVDDVNPLLTVAGAAGAIASLLGLLGLCLVAFMRPSRLGRSLGLVVGLIGGLGAAELLQQTAFLSPSSTRDLAVPIAGALAGMLVAGSARGTRGPRPAPH